MNTLSTKKTKDKVSTNIKSNLIRLGSSLMLPISIIPFAALLLGIATFFPSHSVFGNLLSSVAYIPIRLLPLLFALSIVNT
ncbi:MAG: hypothetical protein DRQ78_01145 [Epsilonproteobacteria bacterium]|nr:MAG: hypothetical protein DRQ78_01145 [Campylobacterota bacterium]